jgi:hypothetical protein
MDGVRQIFIGKICLVCCGIAFDGIIFAPAFQGTLFGGR